jgi:hypothetical protein
MRRRPPVFTKGLSPALSGKSRTWLDVTLERIASAPLNSDRLPSMWRRHMHYPSGFGHAVGKMFSPTRMREAGVSDFKELDRQSGRNFPRILVGSNYAAGRSVARRRP